MGKSITGYQVKLSAGKGCRTTGALSCTISNLKNGRAYEVKVRAFAGARKSSYSEAITVVPGIPTAPTDAGAEAGNGQAVVSFSVSTANGSPISHYTATATDLTDPSRGGQSALGGAGPLTVTGLSNGDRYSFTVTATNAVGISAPSAPSPAVIPGLSPTLNSTGASFASKAMQQWVGQVADSEGIDVNWQPSNSVEGLDDFARGQMDFAASDFPFDAGGTSSAPDQPYQYLPDVGGGLGLMSNLTGTDGRRITDLKLDAAVIDQIFLGQITAWNSPTITAINPQLAGDLPATAIVPVYRSDASGENYLLSDYLLHLDTATFSAAQNAFHVTPAGQPSALWPTPTGTPPTGYPGWINGNLVAANGSDSAADDVAALSSNGAITYIETAYAEEHSIPVASLVNASGADVQPTSANVATALASATLNPDLTQNLADVYTSPVPGAYPLSAYSYLVALFAVTGPSGRGCL